MSDTSELQPPEPDIRWSILIPTVPSRRNSLWKVLTVLEPQVAQHDDIELLVLEDNRKRSYGEKLQAMIDIAQGTYVSFVDDDDMVNAEYVACIYPWLDGVRDCVGIIGEITVEGLNPLPVYYSIQYPEWKNTPEGYYRSPQHLNPIRRDIVRQVPWTGHYGADKIWADEVAARGLIQTEYMVSDKPMYYYCSTQENREGVWDIPEPSPEVEEVDSSSGQNLS